MSRRQRHHKDRELTPYQQKLLDPRWQKKRLEIFERDGWECQRCGETRETLAVHHRLYFSSTEPWEVPDRFLETICEPCHESETVNRPRTEQNLLLALRGLGASSCIIEHFANHIHTAFPPLTAHGGMAVLGCYEAYYDTILEVHFPREEQYLGKLYL